MLAIGVGGADAVDAMTGTPWELKAPNVIGSYSFTVFSLHIDRPDRHTRHGQTQRLGHNERLDPIPRRKAHG